LKVLTKNPGGGRQELEQALKLLNSPAEAYRNGVLQEIVSTYLMENQPDQAIKFLKDQIGAHPSEALLHHYLGEVYLRQRKGVEAIGELQAALSIDPKSVPTLLVLSEAYMSSGKPDQAAPLLQRLAQQESSNSEVQLRVGVLHERAQHWKEAQDAYQRVL